MNQIEILVVPKIKTQKKKLYWCASYRNGYKKWPWIYLSKKTWNSCALPRKVPAMSRFLTKQGSVEIYWRKGGEEQIGVLFFNTNGWGSFKQLRGGPVRTKNSTFHFNMAPSMCKCLPILLCIELGQLLAELLQRQETVLFICPPSSLALIRFQSPLSLLFLQS